MEDAPKVAMLKDTDGRWVCPVFLEESDAKDMLKQIPMAGQTPVSIGDLKYLVGMMEFLQSEGLHKVHLFVPVPDGLNRCEIKVGDFIAGLRVYP